jgi:hypothetical protein
MPPMPPAPPKAPKPPKITINGSGAGISVSIKNGKIHIQGLDQLVSGHLQSVRNFLANNPNLPKDVRDRLMERMDRVTAIVNKNVKQLDTNDLDKLDDQLEKMGDELEKALEGLDADLDKLGDKLGKDLAKDIKKNLKIGPNPPDDDHDDDHDDTDTDTDDDGMANVDPASDVDAQAAVDSLKNFSLKPAQKAEIARLKNVTDKQVEIEKLKLETASKQLEAALESVDVSNKVVEGYVDQITTHEAAIRKARLLQWVESRRMLDADQRKQLEAATRHTK